MRTIAVSIVCWLLFLSSAAGQVPAEAEARAKGVAAFVDDQVIAIAYADLARIDVDALASKLTEIGKLATDDLAKARLLFRGWKDGLVQAGAREVYLVVNLADLPNNPPLAVVPLEAGGKPEAITAALRSTGVFSAVKTVGRAVVAGREETLQRVERAKEAARPDLAQAFAAAGDGALQVVLLLTPELRRSLEEVMPVLPKPVGGSIAPFTRGFQWGALGLNTNPKLSLRGVAQCRDAAAAKEVHGLLLKIFFAFGMDGQFREALPDYVKVVTLLTPTIAGERLTWSLDEENLVVALLPFVVRMRGSAARMRSANNLKQLALAMHNYHDTYRGFPAHASYDKQGKPLLSWRVHVLPFLDQDALYKEFRLNEPWDSEHNQTLIARMPDVFRPANAKLVAERKTCYLAPVGKETIFTGGPKGLQIREILDGTSNTIMLVDTEDFRSVIWTKPEDLPIDPKQPLAGMAGADGQGFFAAFADGSVRLIPKKLDPMVLQFLFTRSGGEIIPAF